MGERPRWNLTPVSSAPQIPGIICCCPASSCSGSGLRGSKSVEGSEIVPERIYLDGLRNNWKKDHFRKKDSEGGSGVCLVYCRLLVSGM